MKDIKIQLYKEDGKGVEGFLTITETSDFPITKALADIKDISKRKSTTSKSIKLGGTKENNLLLGNIYDIDTASLTFNINKIQKCAVLIDGELFLNNCILQLTDITKVQHNSAYESDIEYTVNIKSNNADFFSIIKNKELTDLTFGENEIPNNNFIFNANNIIDSFGHDYTDGFKYVLPHFTGNTEGQIPINTFRPAIYGRTYFDKILKEANFRYTFNEIQGTDRILHFNKLLVPYSDKESDKQSITTYYNAVAENTDQFTLIKAVNTVSSPTLKGRTYVEQLFYPDILNDGNGSWDGDKYTSQFSGSINVNIDAGGKPIFVNNTSANIKLTNNFLNDVPNGVVIGKLNVYMVLTKNGVDIPITNTYVGSALIKNGTVINASSSLSVDYIQGNISANISVEPGDVVEVKAFAEIKPESITIGGNTYNDVVTSAMSGTSSVGGIYYYVELDTYNLNITTNLTEVSQNFGNIIDLNNFIPKKVKQSDFIKSILNIYNLYVIPDENDDNLLHFKTRDKFLDEGKSHDWTEYLVKDKDQILNKLSQDQKKNKLFTYKADKNEYNVNYTAETNEIYGQATFTFDDEYIFDEDKVELVFSPSPYVYQPEDNMYLTDIPTDSNIRLLYDGGVRECNTTFLYEYKNNNNTLNGVYITEYPLTIHFDDFENPTFDLNFNVCPAYFSKPNVLTNNNLFNNYWRRTMHQLNSGYMLTAYFNLDENIVSSLKLNEKIYVEGKWYNINQIIDYNPAKSKIAKVELITVDDGASTYKGLVTDTSKPGVLDPNKKPGRVDTFINNNDFNTNPGRPNTGTGVGNIINGFDNHVSGNGNTISTNNSKVSGNGNTVNSPSTVSGNNNKVADGLNNVIIFGDDKSITESNTIAVENIIVDNLNGVPIQEAIPTAFIDLTDTPNDYDGLAGYKVVVNDAEDGLQFIPDSSSALTGSTSIAIVSGSIQRAALTGDVTAPANSNTTTIANNAVTNAKLADMPTMTIKGNNTAGTADPLDLTIDQLKVMLENATAITQANLGILCSSGTIVPDKLYRVIDCNNTIFRGVTESTVKSEYVVIRAIKPEYYNMSTGGNNKGIISLGLSYASGNYAIWGGRVWLKGTGTTTMSVLPTDNLNPNIGGSITNWTPVADTSNVYYENKVLAVEGDIFDNHNNWILRGSNNNTIVANMISNTGTVTNTPFATRLRCDWGASNMRNNTATLIINNALYGLGGGALLPMHNNNVNGGIYGNSLLGTILGNKNDGNIMYNNNIGSITLNSNAGDISNNTNGGSISNNTNADSISNNSNNGDISYNSNEGYINSNINNGAIFFNNNSGYILSNSNNGSISFNKCSSIVLNSHRGSINNNTNTGVIAFNYQHPSYPTVLADINFNSNIGDIGGGSSSDGNRLRGHIINNDNAGSIYANTNNGVYTYNYNGSITTAQIGNNSNNGVIRFNSNSGGIAMNFNDGEIFNNSNNGAISNNTGAGRINDNSNFSYINNNKNNGSIVGNSNRGYIADNMNNGAINNNTSASTGYFNNYISNNRNNGYINNNNFTATSVHISYNNNNGTIGSGSTTNRNMIVNDVQVNK